MPDPVTTLSDQDRLKVFISSTITECAAERLAARAGVQATNNEPILFEHLGARAHPPRDLYLSRLRSSQIVVAIYRDSYGWIDEPGGMTVSGLEDEYRHARQWGKPVLAYVRKDDSARTAELAALVRDILAGDLTVSFYGEADELADRIRDDLTALVTQRFLDTSTQDAALLETSRAKSGPQDLAGGLVPRPNVMSAISQGLSTARVVQLIGPAGSGKSVALAEHARQSNSALVNATYLSPKELFGVLANLFAGRVAGDALQFATLDGARDAFSEGWRAAGRATVLVDDPKDAQVLLEAIPPELTELGPRLVLASREPYLAEATSIVEMGSLSDEQIRDWLGPARFRALSRSGALQSAHGQPLRIRQLAFETATATQAFTSLEPTARELLSYVVIAGFPLTLEQLLELRADSSCRPDELADEMARISALVADTSMGYVVVHDEVRRELLALIQASQQRYRFAATRLGRQLADGGAMVRAFEVLDPIGGDPDGELLEAAAYEAGRSGDQKTSLALQLKLRERALGHADRSEALYWALALSQTAEAIGDLGLAKTQLEDAERLAETMDGNTALRVRETRLGFDARRTLSPSVVEAIQALHETAKARGNLSVAGRTATELCVIFMGTQDYPAAEAYARYARDTFRDLGDAYGVEIASRNLAAAILMQADREEEADAIVRGLSANVDPNARQRHRAWLCNLLVRKLRRSGQTAEALERAEEAISIGEALGDRTLIAVNQTSKANVKSDLDDYPGAIGDYEAAAANARSCGRPDLEAHASYLMAQTYNEWPDDEGRPEDAAMLAEESARHAVDLVRGTVARDHLSRALEALGDALLAQGRGKEAAEAQFEAAEIIVTLQRWGRLEGVFMTALWNTIDDDPEAYIRGIRRVFGLAPETSSDGALTPRMFSTLSDVMPMIPAAIALPFYGAHMRAMFEGLPPPVRRNLFIRQVDAIVNAFRPSAAPEPWQILYPSMTVAAVGAEMLTAADLTVIAEAVSDVVPGLHHRSIPDAGLHWVVELEMAEPVVLSITAMDEMPEITFAAMALAFFLKGFEGELRKKVFGTLKPRPELCIYVVDLAEAPDDIAQPVRDAIGERSSMVSRQTDPALEPPAPTAVFIAEDFVEGLTVGQGRGGSLQVLLGYGVLEIVYSLLRGEVEHSVLSPKLVELVKTSIS